MITNTSPQNKADRSNNNQLRNVSSLKNLTTISQPVNNILTKPVAKPNPPPFYQSNKPKKLINNKGEETLDASIHAHDS